jgi:hypothetical protein
MNTTETKVQSLPSGARDMNEKNNSSGSSTGKDDAAALE